MNRSLARLIASQICIHASMAAMRMAVPLLALKQGYSALAVGVVMSLFALTQVFLALPAGRYTDKHGLKRPVRVATIMGITGAGLAVLFPVLPVLCVSALLTGGATGAASLALQRHVGRAAETPTQLKQVFSWLALGPAISNFLGPFCAGLFIDHAGTAAADLTGFRAAFLFAAVLPLASWWWVHGTRELPSAAPPEDAGKQRVTDLLRIPMMQRLLVVNWFLSSCWDVHTFVLPVLGHERGLSASVIGTILGLFAIAAAAVRLVLPLVAAHLRESVVISAVMLWTAALFGIYPLLTSVWAMAVCSILLGLALGSVQPMVMSTLHQITPPHRHGEALALRLMTLNGSSVVMPLLFGSAGVAVGVSVVFWAVGAMVGLGATAAWKLRAADHLGHHHGQPHKN